MSATETDCEPDTAIDNGLSNQAEEDSRNPPLAVTYRPQQRGLFVVDRQRGHTLLSGGYGVAISENGQTRDHLFLEAVLVLHEQGLLEAFNGDQQQSLSSADLYGMLGQPGQVSLPVYLAYAHLRAQTYRVIRHTPTRRAVLDDMQAVVGDKDGGEHQKIARGPSMRELRLRLRADTASAKPPTMAVSGTSCQPAWDVYLPDASFSRSCPGRPDFYTAVTSFSAPLLSFDDLLHLQDACQGIPLKLATVSDGGTVVMFGLSNVGVADISNRQSLEE